MFVLARAHAQRVYRQFRRAVGRAVQTQQQVLFKQLATNADSEFGQSLRFDQINDVKSFVQRVPIHDYEALRPFIERVKAGEHRALFGSKERLLMFALTSGTTAEPKYIPVTSRFLASYRQGWNAFGIKALLDHPEAFLRGILQISSRMDESRTSSGLACGAITGLLAATQKRLVRRYYVAPECISRIDEPAAKYYTIMRLGLANDVAFTITASPATQLKLARVANEYADDLIRDIHDGTLRSDLPIPEPVRASLVAQLKASPARARQLEALITEHGELLPKHYWDLSFVANWTGGTMGLYLKDFPHYFGDIPVRDIGLLASEGRISLPIEDNTASGILDITSGFFEFIPVDRIDETSPQTLPCDQLEVGQQYYVLMTNAAGLYRYNIGDVVRVTGYIDQAPMVEFLNKGDNTSSLAGEKLTERQVIEAVQNVNNQLGLGLEAFVLAARWQTTPCYCLHVDESHCPDEVTAAKLAETLDQALAEINCEYASRRESQRLDRIQINELPAGLLARIDHEQAEQRRAGNEQFKHRFLYCQPGQDAHLPLRESASQPHR
jgi:hypothetical protein